MVHWNMCCVEYNGKKNIFEFLGHYAASDYSLSLSSFTLHIYDVTYIRTILIKISTNIKLV